MKDTTKRTDTTTDIHIDDHLKNSLGGHAPIEVQERCSVRFQTFEQDLREKEKSAPKERRSGFFLLRPAWASGALASTLFLIVAAALLMSHASTSWADVVNTFKTVRYFSATVFMTQNPLKPPVKIEFWRAHDGNIRIHSQGLIFFGQGDRLLKVFHADSGQEVDIEKLSREEKDQLGVNRPMEILKKMGSMPELSLNHVLDTFCGRKVISAPIPNAEASISTDMQVFDVTNNRSPEWMRIWTLKSSSLPVRLRHFDPRDGDSVDVLFEYMKEQPAAAFDPDAYKNVFRKEDGGSNRVYALLQDPGGRQLTPKDLFNASGYHMPQVKRVGRMADGVVWVESTNSSNRTPDGRVFFGFGKLTDDAGQEYVHRGLGHRVEGDLTLEYFVPLTYRLDYRKPASYQLTCWTQPDDPRQASEVVGSIPIDKWQEGTPIPTLFGKAPSADEPLKITIEEYRARADWNRFDKLLALIPGEPESDPLALFREEQRLKKLVEMKKHEDVLALASRLYPLVRPSIAKDPWTASPIARAYTLELARQGKYEQATDILRQHIEALKTAPRASEVLGYFVAEMNVAFKELGLPSSQMISLFPEGILNDPEVREKIKMYGGQGHSVEEMKLSPETAAWRKYLDHLSGVYNTRPLPETMEFLTGKDAFNDKAMTLCMDLPGHSGYSVFKLPSSWEEMARSRAYGKGWDPRLIRVDARLKDQKIQAVCVMKKEQKDEKWYSDSTHALDVYMEQAGVEIAEASIPHKVWVARYDGRKLPYWREVKPLQWEDSTDQPLVRQGGTQSTANAVIQGFVDAANNNRSQQALTDAMVYLVDETGLPQEPGDNQTWASICLCYEYQFWTGDEATELARDWFKNTFGITFHEEERTLAFHEIRAKATGQAPD